MDSRLSKVEIEVACDIKNCLTGENGASYVFGPQKGADSKMIKILDNILKNFSDEVRSQLEKEIDRIEGSGSAGGLGAALAEFFNAKMKKRNRFSYRVFWFRRKGKRL